MENTLLNLVPASYLPEVHLSQYDVGRELKFTLKDGSSDYTVPSGAVVTVKATKPSGLGFVVNATAEGSIVTLSNTETMTNENGRFPAELSITQGSTVIGTSNFIFNIERSPHPEGTIDGDAESLLPELTLLVERVESAASSVLDMQVVANTLPAGSQATYSYDEELNKATFGIPQGEAGGGAVGVVALAYDSSKTYNVGEYAIHGGSLYRCVNEIATAEEFTASNWAEIVLSSDLIGLKDDVQSFKKGIDLLPFDVIENSYVTKQGTIATYNGWNRTSYIGVEEGKVLHIVGNGASAQYNCWFDADKNFKSAFSIPKGDDVTVTVPQGAKYVMFSNPANSLASKFYYEQSYYLDTSDFKTLDHGINSINEYYFQGDYAVKKADLKQGYFSDGVGFITSGGDANKYLTYMMTDKLRKGSFVKITSDRLFCGIGIYSDNNWDGDTTKLESANLGQNYEFTMSRDGYLLIYFASAVKYADRVAISLEDFSESVKIVPMLENISDFKYIGEKINTKKHGFSAFKSSWQFVNPTNANAESGQSATRYGNTIFKCWHHDVIQSYNAESGELLAEFEAMSGHGNSISFSDEFYDEADTFPLAYVTPEVTTGGMQLFYVLRLTTTGASLVRTIAVPTANCGYFANSVVDPQKNILYLNGYTFNTYRDAVVSGEDNLMRITAWDLNDLTVEGEYYRPAFIKEFKIPFISTHQGHAFFDNKIFSVKSEISNTQTEILAIDPYKEEVVSIFSDFPSEIKNNECEGIWFADNGNDYSMFICRLIQVYECVFN